jgi:hypothetical protein
MSPSEPKEFIVNHDADSNCSIELDVDMNYRACKNHFRLYSRFDTSVGECEYEYKIEGTSVFVRLFQDKSENPGEPEYWDVRDGVVQQTEIRERERRSSIRMQPIEEKVEQLKKATEWNKLAVTAWNGFPYFLLTHNLPRPDARRYFRQELERLTNGERLIIEAAAKLGYEPRDAGKYHPKGYRTLQLIKGREEPSRELENSVDLPGVLSSVGLTLEEFNSGPNLISQLHELLKDNVEGPPPKLSRAAPLAMKAISWLTATVLMAGYYAFALMLMWNWFVAEGLHFPELSFVRALGLVWTINLLKGTLDASSPTTSNRWELLFSVLDHCVPEDKAQIVRDVIKEKTETVWAGLFGSVFGQAIGVTFTLGLGWTAHTFFL